MTDKPTDKECYDILIEKLNAKSVKRLRSLCRNPHFSVDDVWRDFVQSSSFFMIPPKVEDVLYRGMKFMKELEKMAN